MVYTDLHYFGAISYYKALAQHELVVFDNTAAFSKMSFKNRMVIATAQGPLHLSIPIEGGRDQKTPMNEIKIANSTFQYQQVFDSTTGFIQNVCIVDALFAMGGKQVLAMIS